MREPIDYTKGRKARGAEPLLPNCRDLEDRLIGCLFAPFGESALAWRACLGAGLTSLDFYRPDNARTYAAVRAVWEAHETVGDIGLTLDALIAAEGAEDGPRLMSRMGQLAALEVEPQGAAVYVAKIIEYANHRRLIALGSELAQVYAQHPPELARAETIRREIEEASARGTLTAGHIRDLADIAASPPEDLRWLALGLLPAGLAILGGRPKMGKSWLALQLGMAIAAGGPILDTGAERGRALYLALEDSDRRVLERAQQMLGGADRAVPRGLEIATRWPTLDHGGLEQISQWARQAGEGSLIIIDTLAKIRGEHNTSGESDRNRGGVTSLYAQDYAVMSRLKEIADARGGAILVVHHLRKSGSGDGDPVEELSGTSGIAGAADTILILKRGRGEDEGSLFMTGRDLEERELGLRRDRALGLWSSLGDAADAARSRERRDVLTFAREAAEPVSPAEIADGIGKPISAIRMLTSRMARSGELVKVGRGRYTVSGSNESQHERNVTS